jgi:hypothetical protein
VSEIARAVAPLPPPHNVPAISYDGTKPADEIELDIARTRAELATTLTALERKLMPGQVFEKGVVMLKETIEGDFTNIAERIRENPLAVALIGAGIGWMLLSGTSSGNARDSLRRGGEALRSGASRAAEVARDAAERLQPTADAARRSVDLSFARQKLGDAAGYIGEEARHLWQGAAGTVGDMMQRDVGARAKNYADYASDQASRIGQRAAAVVEERPLVFGGLGLVAGVLIGLALPSRRSFGEGPRWRRFGGEGVDPMAARMSRSSSIRTEVNRPDKSMGGGSETLGAGEAQGTGL